MNDSVAFKAEGCLTRFAGQPQPAKSGNFPPPSCARRIDLSSSRCILYSAQLSCRRAVQNSVCGVPRPFRLDFSTEERMVKAFCWASVRASPLSEVVSGLLRHQSLVYDPSSKA